MKLSSLKFQLQSQRGSVMVIVLMICIGLISIALYFANSMTMELRAADNRTSGMAADQAIEGAARYLTTVLSYYGTNGITPTLDQYAAEAVPVGNSLKPEENAHFWLIGRDLGGVVVTDPHFAIFDEASKLNLNAEWLNADLFATNIPGITEECAEAIVDWRSTNDTGITSLNYAQMGYLPKHSEFETVGEMRLLYGVTTEMLEGDDRNRNGVLDANEQDLNGNGQIDPGLLEYFTAVSREPNTLSDGSSLTNVNSQTNLQTVLESHLGSSRASEIIRRVFNSQGGTNQQTTTQFTNLLQFYVACNSQAQMTADEFSQIYNDITATTNSFTIGRVNVNTAPAAVLACLPGMNTDLAQQLVDYRVNNSVNLDSFAWIVDALGVGSPALQALAGGDYITGKSYQFTADVAALGPFGRGYRRVRFIFDTSEGTPKIIYRQDLSRLGWALGRQVRETWVTANTR